MHCPVALSAALLLCAAACAQASVVTTPATFGSNAAPAPASAPPAAARRVTNGGQTLTEPPPEGCTPPAFTPVITTHYTGFTEEVVVALPVSVAGSGCDGMYFSVSIMDSTLPVGVTYGGGECVDSGLLCCCCAAAVLLLCSFVPALAFLQHCCSLDPIPFPFCWIPFACYLLTLVVLHVPLCSCCCRCSHSLECCYCCCFCMSAALHDEHYPVS
jgi:hypothetical protein